MVYTSLVLFALGQAAPQVGKGLPVLFQFSDPTHNVAVFRGAALKEAIAAGVVKGFGSLGGDSDAANSGEEGRDGRSDDGDDGSNYAPPTTAPPTTDLSLTLTHQTHTKPIQPNVSSSL